MYEYDINREFYGIIKEKEIKIDDHGARVLYIGNSIESINWNFYELIELGDSISKDKGDNIIKLYKKNGIVLEFDYNEHHKNINPSGYNNYVTPDSPRVR